MTDNNRAAASIPLTNAHTPTFGLSPGPIAQVHAFWLAGMSCDGCGGCSIAAVGAQSPSVEQLISGAIPGLPKVILHHPVLAVEAGETFMAPYRMAREGKLSAPHVVIYEGSVADERIAAHPGDIDHRQAECAQVAEELRIPAGRDISDFEQLLVRTIPPVFFRLRLNGLGYLADHGIEKLLKLNYPTPYDDPKPH